MAQFEKRPGAPAGRVTITTSQSTFVFDDGTSVTVSLPDDLQTLRSHPYIRIVGGTESYDAPPAISQVFLRNGVLTDAATGLPVAAGTITSVSGPGIAMQPKAAASGGGGGGGTTTTVTVGGDGAPSHPLDYSPISRKGIQSDNGDAAAKTAGTAAETATEDHRVEIMPRDIKNLGILFINAQFGFGFFDRANPNSITVKAYVGKASGGEYPYPARAFRRFDMNSTAGANYGAVTVTDNVSMSASDIDTQSQSFTLAPGSAMLVASGQSFKAGDPVNISTFASCNGAAGEVIPVGGRGYDTTASETGKRLSTATDNAGAAFGSWTTSSPKDAFSYIAIVDLGGTDGGSVLACGDSLMMGASYGGALGMKNSGVPYFTIARSGEQLQQFVDLDSKSLYRRLIMSRLRWQSALIQVLTNDAGLDEAVSPQTLAKWQSEQDTMISFLKRRGVQNIGWATVPPNTGSIDAWTTTAGQYLIMQKGASPRGPHQQLMQDWNNHLRSGTLLYSDSELSIYDAPAGRKFRNGWVVCDWWKAATILEPVNTSVVPSDTASTTDDIDAGYNFGGNPIMKWNLGWTTSGGAGLHDDGPNNSIRASAVAKMAKHVTGIVKLY